MSKNRCQMTNNFADEIKILQKLDHPNLVRFYEFYQDEDNYYLVTELCKGGNLLSMLETLTNFTEKTAAKIMREILIAVDYCHKNNIVHRDIKPENILFEEPDIKSNVKLIDFGRSKILLPTETLMELAGSLYYIAPEVAAGKEYDASCDIWSLSLIHI
eukprot:TRINITY_DN2126_c0_g1_i1.p1 TRINITY_DN2126_c0_g1~~TRINITY_DN2126_c0_g1_i1.p1  ORF type:complete len:159 (+),score=30.23 TRINITY_DN2126_c0_g1_i1:95-571(+)